MTEARRVSLKVDGMTCEGCVNAATRIIEQVDATATVTVDLKDGAVQLKTLYPTIHLARSPNISGYPSHPL